MGKRTLDEMQRELTEDEGRFLRIHKSFLVNMNDISTLKRYQVSVFPYIDSYHRTNKKTAADSARALCGGGNAV